MEKDANRLKVIDNIKESVKKNEMNNKVELGDPVITDEQREKIIVPFDILRKKKKNKIKQTLARRFTNVATGILNKDTEIVGLENLEELKNQGFIVTCNHFHFFDSTPIRKFILKIKREKNFYILIEETNVLMNGLFGFLLNNCSTIPYSNNMEYLLNNFYPSLKKLFDNKGIILVYPEQELWYNYKKPRPEKIGAFHFAAKYNVPILPCFIEMQELDEHGKDGFKKVKYIVHILKPIYPNNDLSSKERKNEMMKEDYKAKVEMYEKAYNKKLDYTFSDWDIAGLE